MKGNDTGCGSDGPGGEGSIPGGGWGPGEGEGFVKVAP